MTSPPAVPRGEQSAPKASDERGRRRGVCPTTSRLHSRSLAPSPNHHQEAPGCPPCPQAPDGRERGNPYSYLLPRDPEALLDPVLPVRLAVEVHRANASSFLWATLGIVALWLGSVADAWRSTNRP